MVNRSWVIKSEVAPEHKLGVQGPGQGRCAAGSYSGRGLESSPLPCRMAPERPVIGSRAVGIELGLLAILGAERRFVAPAQAEIEGEVAHGLPVGLGIEGVRPPARQPSGRGLGKGGRDSRCPAGTRQNCFRYSAMKGDRCRPWCIVPDGSACASELYRVRISS